MHVRLVVVLFLLLLFLLLLLFVDDSTACVFGLQVPNVCYF